MGHTKGPWIVCTLDDNPSIVSIEQDRNAIDEEPSIIGEIDLCGDGITEATGMANARLIAAAPDLLAALRELAEIGEAGVIERRETGKPTWSALDAVKSIARAAISAAEGGEG